MNELKDRYQNNELPEGELSDEENRLLEAKLDGDFKNRWAAKLAEQGVHRQGGKTVRLTSRRYWFAAAAALLILVAASLWLFLPGPSPAKVLADADLPYAFPGSGRSLETGSEGNWKEAVRAYEQGRFDSALELANALQTETPQLDFFKGMCRFHASPPDYAGALDFFNQVTGPDERFFYAALAHLHLNQQEEAKAALEKTLRSEKLRANYKAKSKLLLKAFFGAE